ncbi:MBL fold metallo-hydrolase [Falsirhodobacter halotolerans]|uniref:MBL fold metallo-hydrolase n=1 Tax=Falsirhodobacter halotolerans TaxID=1146892 RepID=UPI001FD4BE12|nr:MBL fold metallo-hydrolase [Falsirhodobacter halotolerans]MCJ8139934.1 MBL fold metallo-hydrolase [Falsirhodobacter halotolerans]
MDISLPYGQVTWPEPGIRCILAPNPTPMTGRGTNTYILGTGKVAILDPGPDDPRHLAALTDALRDEEVSHILLTHDHADHLALAHRLSDTVRAPICGLRTPQSTYEPDLHLADGDILGDATWRVQAIHTPGHTDDHLCFGMGDICLTGDHVMGWATSAIIAPRGRVDAYVASLKRLALTPWRRFLSAHGDPINQPAHRLDVLIRHRLARERAILDVLTTGPKTQADIVAALYTGLPEGLMRAATRNVEAHLLDLLRTRKAAFDDTGHYRTHAE